MARGRAAICRPDCWVSPLWVLLMSWETLPRPPLRFTGREGGIPCRGRAAAPAQQSTPGSGSTCSVRNARAGRAAVSLGGFDRFDGRGAAKDLSEVGQPTIEPRARPEGVSQSDNAPDMPHATIKDQAQARGQLRSKMRAPCRCESTRQVSEGDSHAVGRDAHHAIFCLDTTSTCFENDPPSPPPAAPLSSSA